MGPSPPKLAMAPKPQRGEQPPLPPLDYYIERAAMMKAGGGKSSMIASAGKGAKGLSSASAVHPAVAAGRVHPMSVRPQQYTTTPLTSLPHTPSTSLAVSMSQGPSSSTSRGTSHDDGSVLPAYERSELCRAKSKPKDKPKQVEVRNLTRGDKRKAMDIARDP